MTSAWVIVTGDFWPRAGQGEANHALATYLAERGGVVVHLVGHRIDPELCRLPSVIAHRVGRPVGSHLLGQPFLSRRGRSVAKMVTTRMPGARVVVNGGNCRWPDVNWVHMVHAAWWEPDRDVPRWLRLKSRVARVFDLRAERDALAASRLIVANSQRTRQDLIDAFGIDPDRIRVIRLGIDPDRHRPVTPSERCAARRWLGVPDDTPLVAFVGSLARARCKGFDTLLSSWRRLRSMPRWRADLVVAGGGPLRFWQRAIDRLGLRQSVRLLGHLERVSDVLAAADLLVSPSRYESFGLNVQEALCRGIPAITTSQAGVSELYPPELASLVLPEPEDVQGLTDRIRRALCHREPLRPAVQELSATLRAYTWRDMAERMVSEIEAKTP